MNKLMTAVATATLACAAVSRANFVKVSDFETGGYPEYNPGSGNHAMVWPNNGGISFPAQKIAAGTTGTLFFQIREATPTPFAPNVLLRIDSNNSASLDFNSAMLYIVPRATGVINIGDGSGENGYSTPYAFEQWNNMWFVINNTAHSYDWYMGDTLGNSVSPTLIHSGTFESGAVFGDIQALLFKSFGDNSNYAVDNIYVDQTTSDLINPSIPEPATLASLALGAAGLLTRRRK